MKKLPIAAVALFFGSSAYAMTPSTQPTGAWADKDTGTILGTTALASTDSAFQLRPAAVDWWDRAQPDHELKPAAYGDDFTEADADADEKAAAIDVANEETGLEPTIEQMEPVSAEDSVLEGEPVPAEDGVGGPYEAADMAAADLTPRPAAQNYPACRPGPGDDNCIQLYEPGVPQQLAAWNQPTGGFAGSGETQVAMGGPYEPVDNSAIETARVDNEAMNGDREVDVAIGEAADDEELAAI